MHANGAMLVESACDIRQAGAEESKTMRKKPSFITPALAAAAAAVAIYRRANRGGRATRGSARSGDSRVHGRVRPLRPGRISLAGGGIPTVAVFTVAGSTRRRFPRLARAGSRGAGVHGAGAGTFNR